MALFIAVNKILSCNWIFHWQSNWQNVQLNTDLLKTETQVFIQKMTAWLNLNEIRSIIKMREILIKEVIMKGWPKEVYSETFL